MNGQAGDGAGEHEPLGVVVLGAAHTGHAWAYVRALSATPGVRVLGVHDDEPEHARWIGQDFGVPFVPDREALLDLPGARAALVCSTTAEHRELVELAASRGLDVLCEKPLATTVADAEAMVRACREAGVQLHVAHPARFEPVVQNARRAVRDGRIGDVVGMVGTNRGRPPLPPGYPPWITSSDAAGGGALIDHSVHVTDAMRHVTGLEVAEVSAEAGSLLWGLEVDDVAVLLLRFAGGAVGSIDPSWSVPAGNPWDYDFGLRVLGTKGFVELDDGAGALRLVSTAAGASPGLRHVGFGEDPDLALAAAFVASVRAGEVLDPCATGDDGVRSLAVALAGYRSARLGEPVPLA